MISGPEEGQQLCDAIKEHKTISREKEILIMSLSLT